MTITRARGSDPSAATRRQGGLVDVAETGQFRGNPSATQEPLRHAARARADSEQSDVVELPWLSEARTVYDCGGRSRDAG